MKCEIVYRRCVPKPSPGGRCPSAHTGADEGNSTNMEQKEKPLTRAQELRKNATKEENHLWYDFLRTYPVQFLRQKPFGPYIVDFYCHKAKLAIELDGSQHYEGNGPEQDKIRTAYLQEVEKIRVLRFTNLEERHSANRQPHRPPDRS